MLLNRQRAIEFARRTTLPRSVKPHRILAGPLRGVWLVTSWHDYLSGITGRTERPLLDWFARHVRRGETWLDVGARYGYTAFALARPVGATGCVFAFEPVLATAGAMERGRGLNGFPQITIVPVGLADPATLHIGQLPLTCGMADVTLNLAERADVPRSTVTTTMARLN